ncbi:hypothetical protein EDE08_101639 [Bradyrhizobium sp. R2.2-H]|jgi:hypothetical protein|uniref:hypothetical protein n=1 Tax=unclassified Bradyrhizobium TaxID=2631580 RepID=UPI0010496852|nr:MULTISPECIES: hypothetical protein [unclassified Bradyrhizobium]TCU78857.1 hypothetical protein EDE10_101640 [Bradyrhizobium sp. Y-H1]TCU80940.1 hypothetical protein EDE08_101639 [Bradyrhizobium sp. R2.2-H]
MTQNTINALLALGVAAAIALGSFLLGYGSHPALAPQPQSLGGAGGYEALQTWYRNGIYAGSAQQLTVDSSGNIALSNSSATSTISGVGCISAFATSSATPVKLVLSTLGATSTFKGTAYWSYGTCP